MSVKRLAVSLAMVLALAGPSLFPQDAGPGNPDDIAAVFPEDTIVFAEIARPGKLYKDWKDYVGAFCTPQGKAKVIEELDKLSKELDGEAFPEKLVKDFEKGGPTVQRVAVGLSHPRGAAEPVWAIVATAGSDEFFKALIDDFRVFSSDEKTHDGTKILVIRKIGKSDLHGSMVMAAAGKRLIISSSVANVVAVLDRAAGKAKGGDLRKNPAYARFSPAAGDDPTFRGFGEMDWGGLGDLFGGRSYGYRRANAHGMDIGDAITGFRKIRGASIEATFKPGKIAAATRLRIDSPCGLWDILRQPVGPKELLKMIPADGQVVVHFNLRPGKDLLADIDKMVKHGMSLEGRTRNRNLPPEAEQNWKKDFEREVGVPLDDIAAAIGSEVAFSMVGDEAFMGEQNMVGAILFLVSVNDPAKAKAIIEKMVGRMGAFQVKTEGTATLWVPEKEMSQPVIALTSKAVLIGAKVDTIKKALKAETEGSILKQMPASIATASKLISVRNNALWTAVRMGFGAKVPDLSKELDLAALSTVVINEDKNELRISSLDAGLGLELQAAVMMVPFFFVAGRSMMMAGFNVDVDEEGAKKAETLKESPPLPPDQLAAQVSKHLTGMRSDEVVARTDSEAALKALGPQAAKLLAEAVRKENDAEVKGRILDILTAWKAYDAFPELLKTKTDGFIKAFQKATGQEGNGRFGPWIRWREDGMSEFPYGMEPMFWDTALLQRCEHHDLLEAPQGLRALAERLTEGKMNVQTLRNLCAIFAFNESGAAGDLLVAAMAKVEDPESKNFLQIALGYSSDAKAKEAVTAGLKSSDVWTRRASFLACERSHDSALIGKLLELLTDSDAETRWNASYTVRELSGGRAMVNVYVPDAELKTSIAAAREWWEKSKATFKIGE